MSMNFGEAIQGLKQGRKVSRRGWNGRGMWLMLLEPETKIKTYTLKEDTFKRLPYIYMKTADDCLEPWSPSQTDILAEDWIDVLTKSIDKVFIKPRFRGF